MKSRKFLRHFARLLILGDLCLLLRPFVATMELPTVMDSFAVTAEEAETITIMLQKQFASRFTDLDKGWQTIRIMIVPIIGDSTFAYRQTGWLGTCGANRWLYDLIISI